MYKEYNLGEKCLQVFTKTKTIICINRKLCIHYYAPILSLKMLLGSILILDIAFIVLWRIAFNYHYLGLQRRHTLNSFSIK